MDADKAAHELTVIRELMERPVRYSTQSGLAGILAGLAATAGAALSQHVWWRFELTRAVRVNFVLWTAVFVVALVGNLVLAGLRERRHGIPAWSRVKMRILRTILPPFIAAVGLTLATVHHWHQSGIDVQGWLIPAIWMLFYGLALWQLGEFTNIETRVMGLAFLLAGILSATFFQDYPHAALGVTFGGFHIVYGVVVSLRHGW